MKKTILLLLIFISISINAQDNYDLSTLRIGPFKYGMTKAEMEKIPNAKFTSGKDKYGQEATIANYNGEKIELLMSQIYGGENKPNVIGIYNLSTKSPKFKTKSGIGVGNTKDQLLDAYRNYPNYSVNQMWDEKTEKKSTTETSFTLTDSDSYTELFFRLINNVVVEVTVYMNEGC